MSTVRGASVIRLARLDAEGNLTGEVKTIEMANISWSDDDGIEFPETALPPFKTISTAVTFIDPNPRLLALMSGDPSVEVSLMQSHQFALLKAMQEARA